MEDEPKKLPVTLLGGFLGAGKSTLLRHILQAKHGVEDFRCAVLVNDMAELNIDQKLIESTGLIQSEEVISMQNGCVCCSLSGDMADQVTKLANQGTFDYMIIEASGVSEPAAIAALFEECKDDHNHNEHKSVSLFDVAKLDTIVAVVDTAEFMSNLDIIADPERKDFPNLLVEQVEYSNVILLNKTDLVDEIQLNEVKEKVALLNNSAKILTCTNSSVNVGDVVETGLFQSGAFDLSRFVEQLYLKEAPKKSCCKAAVDRGETPCCRRARTLDSGKSQVLLPQKNLKKTRHGDRFQITSFVYTARRPFVWSRLFEQFVNRFYVSHEEKEEEDGEEEEVEKEDTEMADTTDIIVEEKKDEGDGSEDEAIKKLQEEGAMKKSQRLEEIGSLLRMKGLFWQTSAHDLVGFISTAGNIAKLDSPGTWNVLKEKAWKGTEEEKAILRKDWVAPYGDRRQELVFIGQNMNHQAIQSILDSCLVSDEELALGIDAWKAMFGDIELE
ncbi:unnamed protein product, partial [Heterosigma akashiwo]